MAPGARDPRSRVRHLTTTEVPVTVTAGDTSSTGVLDTQVQTLLSLGYPGLAGLGELAFLERVEPLRAVAATLPDLALARPGDVLVLPIHDPAARDDVVAMLDRMHAAQWRAGDRLPEA